MICLNRCRIARGLTLLCGILLATSWASIASAQDEPAQSPSEALKQIEAQMRSAQQLLSGDGPSVQSEVLQRQAVVNLDMLIEQLKKKQPPKGGGKKPGKSGSKPGKSGQGKSAARSATGPSGADTVLSGKLADGAALEHLAKSVWGQLPTKIRDQANSLVADNFLPKYAPIIEQFYRRLADETAEDR